MSNQELQEIIQKLQNGDNSPLKQFFEEHGHHCIEYVKLKTKCDEEDAKDVFSDAIVVLRENLIKGKITELTNERGYLAAISHNQWKKRYHHRKRETDNQEDLERYFYDYRYPDHNSFDPLVDQENREEHQKNKKQRLQKILNALKSLDEKCQKILKLFYVKHLSMNKIAELIGLNNANVAKTAKRRCYLKWLKAIDQQ